MIIIYDQHWIFLSYRRSVREKIVKFGHHHGYMLDYQGLALTGSIPHSSDFKPKSGLCMTYNVGGTLN